MTIVHDFDPSILHDSTAYDSLPTLFLDSVYNTLTVERSGAA
jgi:hypothetical protein